ncbi:hypothetical protein ABPG72_016032 [Tetrahymena utriculariae]
MNSAHITLKLQVSYFDTKQKEIQYSYQTVNIYTSSDQYKTTAIRLQNQETTVKDGLFIQSPQSFTSTGNYILDSSSLNSQTYIQSLDQCPYSFITLKVDQVVQQIAIQYATIPQIFALVNSVFSILMVIGFLFRYISFNYLYEDFFIVVMQSIYQEKYQKILQCSNLYKPTQKISNQADIQNLLTSYNAKQKDQQMKQDLLGNQNIQN